MNFADRIKIDSCGVFTYVDNLLAKKYQIPTFQRDVVWERENVKKLWDSIYKFYPLGSILIWKTNLKLQNHRNIGGFEIEDSFKTNEYQYILDGQQRTTSLLLSLKGGKIDTQPGFDPFLYIDLTVEHSDETDDESYKQRFLYYDEIYDKMGRNKHRIERLKNGQIVKLHDFQTSYEVIDKVLSEDLKLDYGNLARVQARRIQSILSNYRISFIELAGIQVSEVCQIFERINQAGKPLDIFDIVVAKTYRPKEDNGHKAFYLRELFDDFKESVPGNYSKLDNLTFLQILAVSVNCLIPDAGIKNITDRYLNDLKAEYIESVWEQTTTAIRKTFDFLENVLHLKGPELIPFRYFYMALTCYFLQTKDPDYNYLQKYFWYYSFHNEDLLSNTTHLHQHISFLTNPTTKQADFERFLINKEVLRRASYSSKGRWSRAILSLFASHEPMDWGTPSRHVLNDVYYILTDKPNLHHIFPLDYINKYPGANKLNVNSLMNIAYITQITNLEISNKNPVNYVSQYDKASFADVLKGHLIPLELLEWAREDKMPEDSLDIFIEKRVNLIIGDLRDKLDGVSRFEVIDTKEGV